MPHNKNTKIFGNFLYLRTGLTWTFIEISQFIMSKVVRNLFKKIQKIQKNYVILASTTTRKKLFDRYVEQARERKRMRLSLLLLTCFQIDRLKSHINDTTHWVIERRKNSFILDAYQSHWWCVWHNKKKRHLQLRVINHGRWLCKSLVRTSVINWRNDFVKCNNCCGDFPFGESTTEWRELFICMLYLMCLYVY